MAQDKKIDEISGVETTGHEWDGVSELNNPMPKWWVSVFYATIVFGIIYTILFPAWPLATSNTKGVLGYTARGEVAEAIKEHAEMQSVWREQIAETGLDDIRSNPELLNFAMASGQANFAVNCSPCHGRGAAGNEGGFPNLNDDDWIWGGDLDSIYETISHGVRNEESDDARFSEMPRFGADELLERNEIAAVASYVLSLSGNGEATEEGAAIFEENCAACHGDEGLGDIYVGAPNLTDGIWLYGGSLEEVTAQITNPQQGVMPPWRERLGDATVKELTVYVHSLGGGL